MGLSIKIKTAKPLENMILLVNFENGIQKKYDIKTLYSQFPIYKQLENENMFSNVDVICGGCAVAWNDEIDISEVELWEGGKFIHTNNFLV